MEKEQFLIVDGLTTMFNNYLGMVVEHISFLTPASSQIWGFCSCFWSNLCGVNFMILDEGYKFLMAIY